MDKGKEGCPSPHGAHTARNADHCSSHGRSVCLSVMFRCFVQKKEDMIVMPSASGTGRTITLVSGEVKFIRIFAGGTPSKGIKVKQPPAKI